MGEGRGRLQEANFLAARQVLEVEDPGRLSGEGIWYCRPMRLSVFKRKCKEKRKSRPQGH